MEWTPERQAELDRLLAELGPKYAEIARRMGSTKDAIRGRARRFAGAPVVAEAPAERTVESEPSARVKTLDEVLAEAEVDLTQWEVERWVVNKWEVGAKDEWKNLQFTGGAIDGTLIAKGLKVEPLWQVKVWLKPKPGASLEKLKADLLADIAADTALRVRLRHRLPETPRDDGYLLELDVFDLHLGKFAWAEETGHNYDSGIAESVARAAVDDLLRQARAYPVESVILPLGNDFFHFDTAAGTTTAGTPLDRDTRFQKMFRRGRGLASWMIHRCAEIAPVKVLVIPGNHDEQAAFCMGVVLEAEFQHDPRVSFDNSAAPRKYHLYGKQLLGFCHGRDEPTGKLPQLMALEAKQEWADSVCREFHIGHIHTGRKAEPISVDDQTGVTVRWIRSLSGTDAWHARKGFIGNSRNAEAFLWRKRGGLRAHLISLPIEELLGASEAA